ncbi:MAG TPA: integrase core domain-containing protein, partial [Gemmataceae bacterium]|nr:integrase core domain-containing protein [Gemmataceae bacterium]
TSIPSHSDRPPARPPMRFFQPLLALIAASTEKELAAHVEYLKAENRVLRARLPKRIAVTRQEREQLVKYGRPLGAAIKDLVSIVSPRTFLRWLNEPKAKATTGGSNRGPGRPRTAEDVRDLILRLGRENGWGYTRILGEIKRLGVKVSRSTVVNTLKEAGLQPSPDRSTSTWHEFLKRHKDTLWACDFFTKHVWTLRGLVQVYILVFVHVGTRRVIVPGFTANPDDGWMRQQARNLSILLADTGKQPTHLVLDNDTKFTAGFRDILAADGVEVVRTAVRSPNMNATCERFGQALLRECLDHFVVFGEDHLRHLINEYLCHFHRERCHQGLGNVPPAVAGGDEPDVIPFPAGKVECRERLGGLLKHYRRVA